MLSQDSDVIFVSVAQLISTRRRDRLLPRMIERQRRSRIADSARNILAKHHHAVAEIEDRLDYDLTMAAAKFHLQTDDKNIRIILSTQGNAVESKAL